MSGTIGFSGSSGSNLMDPCYQGDSMSKNLSPKTNKEKTMDIYNIQVAQIIDLEADLEASCTDYTDTGFIDFRLFGQQCFTLNCFLKL